MWKFCAAITIFAAWLGHEFVGEVVAVHGISAAAKRKKWLGKRVAGEINVSCTAYGYKPVCDFCRRGLKTHCARRTVLGIVAHDGAFAEYLALPLENLHLIPSNVSDEKAVFVEPLAAACQILDQINIRKFPSAAVLGDGKLAQLIAMVLYASGTTVTLYGKHQSKLKLARNAGIRTKKVLGDARDLKRVKESYRLVVEATGSPTGLTLAQQITEPRGTLLLKSTFHGAARVETWPIVVKEITVVGSRCGPFAKAIALLRSGKVDPTPLISRVYPLKGAPAAIVRPEVRSHESLVEKLRVDLQTVDARRHARRTKSVVNIYDRHIRRARVQHPQQRRYSAKTRSVSDARRHCNHRHAHQSAHHARERAFHTRHANNHPRFVQLAAMIEQAGESLLRPRRTLASTRLPIIRAVSTASSATGISLVPADTTTMVPFPVISLLRSIVMTPESG